jgi:DNA polymerase-3 subunit gamma/tau
MSYQVLARKWRPKNFEQLMGQEHVVTVLVNALTQQRLHHAYLFTGTRGVGKTTIARIFAKSLNCETGITATPCGECDVCQDIDQGRFVDLLEIDAASRTKVDDTREILDNVQYAPTRGRYKVYLIDEVHMLSRSSFNALLKTLEEPPEHVKFILATTDPQKLPVTVLSRCLQFHLKALTVGQIEEKLQQILTAEEVTHETGTLTLLAKAARGSMRDSLSLTDQAIAQGQGHLKLENIQQMLGGVDQHWVYKILIALIKQDAQGLMTLSQEIASYAPSYNRLFAELIQLLHQVAMFQVVQKHFDLPQEHAILVDKFSRAMSAEDIQLYYQIALNGRKDLPYAADEQAAFDMTLLRLLAFKPMQAADETNVLPNTVQKSDIDFEQNLPDTNINQASKSQNNISDTKVVTKIPEQAAEVSQTTTTASTLEGEVENIEPQAIENELTAQMVAIEQQAQTEMAQESPPEHFVTEEPIQTQVQSITTAESPVVEQSPPETSNSAIDSVLATRNMLRSRKKQLEQTPKKSNGAAMRHSQANSNDSVEVTDATDIANTANTSNITNKSQVNKPEKDSNTLEKRQPSVPAIESLPQAPFTPEIIDPAKVRLANQVDKWANMIDAMELSARLRQLAIHATICSSSTDDCLILKLDQAIRHLNSDSAHKQLEKYISLYLQKPVTVEITLVEETQADPFKIQSHINDKRYDYAKELLLNDELVVAFVNDFQATVDESSIVAR